MLKRQEGKEPSEAHEQDFHTMEEGQWLRGLSHVWELVPDHLHPRPVLFDSMGFHLGKETPQVQVVTCL